MKKLFTIGVVCFLFAGIAGAAEKIVFVNLESLFDGFYKTQLAKSKIDVQRNDIETERQSMVDEMTQISEEVDLLKKEARDITLSQEIRDQKRILFEERLLELRDKRAEIEEFTGLRSQQIQMQVARMSQTIMDEIRQAIIEYAKQEGFQAVIDSSNRKAAVGVFIYIHPDVDISEQILAMLNSKRPDIEGVEEDLLDDVAVGEDGQEETADE